MIRKISSLPVSFGGSVSYQGSPILTDFHLLETPCTWTCSPPEYLYFGWIANVVSFIGTFVQYKTINTDLPALLCSACSPWVPPQRAWRTLHSCSPSTPPSPPHTTPETTRSSIGEWSTGLQTFILNQQIMKINGSLSSKDQKVPLLSPSPLSIF